MPYTQKEVSQQKLLLWITSIPILISMAIPMMLDFAEKYFQTVLY